MARLVRCIPYSEADIGVVTAKAHFVPHTAPLIHNHRIPHNPVVIAVRKIVAPAKFLDPFRIIELARANPGHTIPQNPKQRPALRSFRVNQQNPLSAT